MPQAVNGVWRQLFLLAMTVILTASGSFFLFGFNKATKSELAHALLSVQENTEAKCFRLWERTKGEGGGNERTLPYFQNASSGVKYTVTVWSEDPLMFGRVTGRPGNFKFKKINLMLSS